jgi:hypothetical protein
MSSLQKAKQEEKLYGQLKKITITAMLCAIPYVMVLVERIHIILF